MWPFKPKFSYLYKWKVVYAAPDEWQVFKHQGTQSKDNTAWIHCYTYGSEKQAMEYIRAREEVDQKHAAEEQARAAHIVTEKFYGE